MRSSPGSPTPVARRSTPASRLSSVPPAASATPSASALPFSSTLVALTSTRPASLDDSRFHTIGRSATFDSEGAVGKAGCPFLPIMPTRILILSGPEDLHAHAVSEALRLKGAEPVFWHTPDFPTRSRESLLYEGSSRILRVDGPEADWTNPAFDVVWR